MHRVPQVFELQDYSIDLTVIGHGAQAKIVRGMHLSTRNPVAVKIYSLKTQAAFLCFENEARLLHQCLNIPEIVDLHACFSHKQFGFLVMNIYHQDLLSLIMENGGLGEARSANFFRQVCHGMMQSHSFHVAHLDLKPDNVLFSQHEERVFLCDFGNSYQFRNPNEEVAIGRRGTEVYCAPEVKTQEKYNPVKADIWSLGILLHVMVVGYFPHGQSVNDIGNYHKGIVNLSFIQQQCSASLVELLQLILNPVSENRPSIEHILEHPWFCSPLHQPESTSKTPTLKKISGIFSGKRSKGSQEPRSPRS